jgi:uncharacterized protein YcbK (DUF882 family)
VSKPCKYFKIEELTPDKFHDWKYIKQSLADTLDTLRGLFGAPITINKGTATHRGYREKGCGVGIPTGYHYKGAAADFDVKGLTADQARTKIRQWKKEGKLHYLQGIEIDVSWVHIQCLEVPYKGLKEFRP